MSLRFKFLSGDINWRDYGGKFVSKRLNNGELDYWLVIDFTNLDDAMGQKDPMYGIELLVVSPQEAGQDKLQKAATSWGIDDSELENASDLVKVELLADYGTSALLWKGTGNNARALLQEAHQQANLSTMWFGFMMDKTENGYGATGWDAIRGELVPPFTRETEGAAE